MPDSISSLLKDYVYTPPRSGKAYRAVKRAADVAVAGGAIMVLAPLMGLLAVLIKMEDRGPVFYKQFRVGRGGALIPFWKLRSMRVDADAMRHCLLKDSDSVGAAFKMKNDPRITKIGRIMRKLSLDELPQLFGVLAGDMSIIGPRPHLCEEVATYDERQRRRLDVKPGLLCLREIRGRSNLTFEKWIEMDLEYVDSRSVVLDAKILLGAIPAILKGDGAY
jgi:lipopolysaccharide/colanic/teichoic acid biosynthesis glycosyltransferase